MTDTTSPRPAGQGVPSGVDATVPHSARIWNYWLGGKDNYAVDREAGDRVYQVCPGIVDVARAGRAFLTRAVRFLAAECGVRQFLDVGTGLPTADNTHEVAQRVAPDARIVYVDNDPLVLAHARALLTSTPEGATDYVHADMREPEAIVREAAKTLDLTRPVALMLMGVLGHLTDEEARSIISRLLGALPSGSYLALYDSTDAAEALVEAQRVYNESGTAPYRVRSPEHVAGFFDGLELVEPGVVPCPRWRPDAATSSDPVVEQGTLCGVGRKP